MNRFVRFAFALLATLPAAADDYPRQPSIDAQHYVFRIALTDDSEEITAEATATLRFVQAGVTRVSLDLASPRDGKGMSVTEVTSAGAPIPYTHMGDRLTVTLAPAPKAEEVRRIINFNSLLSK